MKKCRLCYFLRYFLASVFFLIIISLTLTEKMHYLSFITPWNVAIFILVSGFLSFLIKILSYYKKRKLTISKESDK